MLRLQALLATGVLVVLVAGVVMFFAQRALLFPRPIYPTQPSRGTAEPVSLSAGAALFLAPARDGVAQDARRQDARAPLIVFFHGNGETAGLWVDEFEPMRRAGWAVLLVEYPGYGGAPGSPSQASIFAGAEAALEWAMRDARIDSARIVAYGRSLGGGPASHLAAGGRLAALVLESAFTSVRPLAARFLVPGFLVRDPFDNLEALRRYRGPLLVIHGTGDDIIPVAHGRALSEAVPGTTFIAQPCGHNDCPRPWPVLLEWLGARGLAGRTGSE